MCQGCAIDQNDYGSFAASAEYTHQNRQCYQVYVADISAYLVEYSVLVFIIAMCAKIDVVHASPAGATSTG